VSDTPASGAARGGEALAVELDGAVATVFLDRPAARNALGPAFFRELPEVFDGLGGDPAVRAVVLAARGTDFSVGLDLHALGSLAPSRAEPGLEPSAAEMAERIHAEVRRLQAALGAVAACAKPVVAAVHGWCIGGGLDLAAACDLRVAASDARFSLRETRMAIVADLGSLQRLPRIVPFGHLAELAYTGKDIDALRAERIGLVNAVLPDPATCLAEARAIAEAIAANSPLAVQGTKAVLLEAFRDEVERSLRFVAAWNAGRLLSADLSEAVSAFLEKRRPRFEGR
jgi:enoyl-CoA hydratase